MIWLKKGIIAPIIVVVLILFSYSITSQNNSILENYNQHNDEITLHYTPHESIIIDHDDDFIDYGFSGNGSSANPYIIENYYISTSEEYGIDIEFTSKHFIIRNCYITADQTGINIEEIGVGTAVIVNNTCIDNFFLGIRIYMGPGAIIKNNTCSNSRDGIHVHTSSWVSVINNTCFGNYYHGIKLEYSTSVSLLNNTIYMNNQCGIITWDCTFLNLFNNTVRDNSRWGVYLYISTGVIMINNTLKDNEFTNLVDHCSESTITGNRFFNDGLTIEDRNTTLYSTYTVEDNWVNNKKLGFFVNLHNYNFSEPVYGQLILVNCTEIEVYNQEIENTDRAFFLAYCNSITVKDNFCKNNSVGMRLYYSTNILIVDNIFENNSDESLWLIVSSNVTITNNSCNNNEYYGIHLLGSHNNTLTENSCNNNIWGIWVDGSDSCLLIYNVLKGNEKHGIYVSSFSDNNIIHHNSFFNNNLEGISQAKDDGNNNTWWDIETKQGNHWSDWRKMRPYVIEGRSNSTDLYPLNPNLERISYEFTLFIPAILLLVFYNKKKKNRKN